MSHDVTRIGIVGYGKLGQYLVDAIQGHPKLKLVFVWNRTASALSSDSRVEDHLILESLADFASREADIIVEVAHPSITESYACEFLKHADYFVGSPTAFANASVEKSVTSAATSHAIYVPSGALWGAQDLQKMADVGTITSLSITMKKHPSSFRVLGSVKETLDAIPPDHVGEVELYSGPVRDLCPLAPNNVNTMACAALAAHTIGFDGVHARLIADHSLKAHVIRIDAIGPTRDDGAKPFTITTERYNPASIGAVTGNLTYASFFSSLLRATGARRSGVHVV